MQLLQGRGAHVEYNDPYFPQLHRMRHYNYEGMKSVPLSPQTLGAYDGVIIATDHSTYDYNAIVDSSKLVVIRGTPRGASCGIATDRALLVRMRIRRVLFAALRLQFHARFGKRKHRQKEHRRACGVVRQ